MYGFGPRIVMLVSVIWFKALPSAAVIEPALIQVDIQPHGRTVSGGADKSSLFVGRRVRRHCADPIVMWI